MIVIKHFEPISNNNSEEKCTCVRHQRLPGQSHVGPKKLEEVSDGSEEECQDQYHSLVPNCVHLLYQGTQPDVDFGQLKETTPQHFKRKDSFSLQG